MTAILRISNMPVPSDTRNRAVAVPARIQGYNTLDEKIKALGCLSNQMAKNSGVNPSDGW